MAIYENSINRWTSEVTRTDEATGERTRLIVYSVDAGNWRVRSNNLVTLRSGIKLRSEAVARAAAILDAHARRSYRELFAAIPLEAIYQLKRAPDEHYRNRWVAKMLCYDNQVRHLWADFSQQREAA